MTRIRVVTLMTFAAIWFCSPAMPQSRSNVSGTVTDTNDSRVGGATVAIEGEGQHLTAQTSQDGLYSIEFKPGRYTITVSHLGFCTWRRPAFVIEPGVSVQFDFELVDCPRAHAMLLDGVKVTGESEHYVGPYRCEILTSPFHVQVKPLVMFGSKMQDGNSIKFAGTAIDKRHLPVILMFNLLTVRSQFLQYDATNQLVEATGNVIVQDGRRTQTGSLVHFKLDRLEPKLSFSD